jgi:hypothetical protein
METATQELKRKPIAPPPVGRKASSDPVETLARDVFLRFLELPGHGSVTPGYLAAKAVDHAEAFYRTLDQVKTEK